MVPFLKCDAGTIRRKSGVRVEVGSGGDSRQRLTLRIDDYKRIDHRGRVVIRVVLEHRGEKMPVNRMKVKVGISEWRFRYATTNRSACGIRVEGQHPPGVTAVDSDPSLKEYTLPSGECEKYVVPSWTIAAPPPYS